MGLTLDTCAFLLFARSTRPKFHSLALYVARLLYYSVIHVFTRAFLVIRRIQATHFLTMPAF